MASWTPRFGLMGIACRRSFEASHAESGKRRAPVLVAVSFRRWCGSDQSLVVIGGQPAALDARPDGEAPRLAQSLVRVGGQPAALDVGSNVHGCLSCSFGKVDGF